MVFRFLTCIYPAVLKVKLVLQIAQHMPKQVKKNYTHRKLNTHKLNNPNAEKIVINRNEYADMHLSCER